jgi:cobalt-zinc-cadmium efflux system outer membrane protein
MKAVILLVAILTTSLVGWSVALPSSPSQTPSIEDLETSLSQKATIADLITYAYKQNPSISAARKAWEATIENYRVVTGYPDPQLKFSYFPEPIETRLGPQDWSVSITQMIPFPGKLSKAGELIQADARIGRLNLNRAVRDVIMSIRESYHELLYIQEAKRVVGQNIQLLEHLRKVGETAYVKDRTTLFDITKAQSQSAQLRYDALLLEELELTENTRLNAILNRSPDADIGKLEEEVLVPIALDLKGLYELAEANQEEIRISEVQVEKANANVDLSRYQNRPDFKLGVFYGSIGEPDIPQKPLDAGRDTIGVQVDMTIPLWFSKNKSRLEQARAELQKEEAKKKVRVNETRTKVHALFFRLENARRLIELYRENLLPQAVQSMEIAETWFREGQSGFSDFIETQAVFYNFRLSLARAHADYGKYLARLERLVGRSLTEGNGASLDGAGKAAK